MDLSIIIPAYNEEKIISRTIKRLINFLGNLPYKYEVILVSDGSTDGTVKKAKEIKSRHLKVISYNPNQGKGYALGVGAKKAKGKYIVFYDAGGDYHPSHIEKFIKLLEALEADIVIGSKRHPMSKINYPFLRRFYSGCFQFLIRLLFNLKVRDTQVGVKLFRKEILKEVLPRLTIKQYAFDVELLVVASQLGFEKISEAPIEMNFNLSKTSIYTKTIFRIFLDTLKIFYQKNLGVYNRNVKT